MSGQTMPVVGTLKVPIYIRLAVAIPFLIALTGSVLGGIATNLEDPTFETIIIAVVVGSLFVLPPALVFAGVNSYRVRAFLDEPNRQVIQVTTVFPFLSWKRTLGAGYFRVVTVSAICRLDRGIGFEVAVWSAEREYSISRHCTFLEAFSVAHKIGNSLNLPVVDTCGHIRYQRATSDGTKKNGGDAITLSSTVWTLTSELPNQVTPGNDDRRVWLVPRPPVGLLTFLLAWMAWVLVTVLGLTGVYLLAASGELLVAFIFPVGFVQLYCISTGTYYRRNRPGHPSLARGISCGGVVFSSQRRMGHGARGE